MNLAEQLKEPLVQVWLPIRKGTQTYYRREWVTQKTQREKNYRLATEPPPGPVLGAPAMMQTAIHTKTAPNTGDTSPDATPAQMKIEDYRLDEVRNYLSAPWVDPDTQWIETGVELDPESVLSPLDSLLQTLSGGTQLTDQAGETISRAPASVHDTVREFLNSNPISKLSPAAILQSMLYSPGTGRNINTLAISTPGAGKTTVYEAYRDYLHGLYDSGNYASLMRQRFADVVVVSAPRNKEDITGLQYIVESEGKPKTVAASPDVLRLAIERQQKLKKPVLLVIDEMQGLTQETQDQLRRIIASGKLEIQLEGENHTIDVAVAGTANFDDRQTQPSAAPLYDRFLPLTARGEQVNPLAVLTRFDALVAGPPPSHMDELLQILEDEMGKAGIGSTDSAKLSSSVAYYGRVFAKTFGAGGITDYTPEGQTIATAYAIRMKTGICYTHPDFRWDVVRNTVASYYKKLVNEQNISISDSEIQEYATEQVEAAKSYTHNMRVVTQELANALGVNVTEDTQTGDLILSFDETHPLYQIAEAYWNTRQNAAFTEMSTVDVSDTEASVGGLRKLVSALALTAQAISIYPVDEFKTGGVVREVLEHVFLHEGSLTQAAEARQLQNHVEPYREAMRGFFERLIGHMQREPKEAANEGQIDLSYLLQLYQSASPHMLVPAFTKNSIAALMTFSPQHDYKSLPYPVAAAYMTGQHTPDDAYKFNFDLGMELTSLRHRIDRTISEAFESGNTPDATQVIAEQYRDALRSPDAYPNLAQLYKSTFGDEFGDEQVRNFAMQTHQTMESLTFHAIGHAALMQTLSSEYFVDNLRRIAQDAVARFNSVAAQFSTIGDNEEELMRIHPQVLAAATTAGTAHRLAHSIKLINDAAYIANENAPYAAAWLGMLDGINKHIQQYQRDHEGKIEFAHTLFTPTPRVAEIYVPSAPVTSDLSVYNSYASGHMDANKVPQIQEALSIAPDDERVRKIQVEHAFSGNASPLYNETLALLKHTAGFLEGMQYTRT